MHVVADDKLGRQSLQQYYIISILIEPSECILLKV